MKINNQANPKPKGLGDEGQRAAFVKLVVVEHLQG